MLKVKRLRTADCVVGGFRYETGSREVGSLLLGLYNEEGKLDHVGFTSTITNAERPALTKHARSADRAAGLHRQRAGRTEPLEHRAHRRMGAGRSRSSWSKCATITSPATASATARSWSASAPTRRRGNAPSSRSSRKRCPEASSFCSSKGTRPAPAPTSRITTRDAKPRDILARPSAKHPPEKFRRLRHLGEEIFKEECLQPEGEIP